MVPPSHSSFRSLFVNAFDSHEECFCDCKENTLSDRGVPTIRGASPLGSAVPAAEEIGECQSGSLGSDERPDVAMGMWPFRRRRTGSALFGMNGSELSRAR